MSLVRSTSALVFTLRKESIWNITSLAVVTLINKYAARFEIKDSKLYLIHCKGEHVYLVKAGNHNERLFPRERDYFRRLGNY
jgi:hypothetical protein